MIMTIISQAPPIQLHVGVEDQSSKDTDVFLKYEILKYNLILFNYCQEFDIVITPDAGFHYKLNKFKIEYNSVCRFIIC